MALKHDAHYSSTHWHASIYSPEDRHQHNNNPIVKNPQPRPLSVMNLQHHHDLVKHGQQIINYSPVMRRPCTMSASSKTLARHSMYSFSLHVSRSTSLYQPQLENYQHDNLSQKQMDRLSNQYSSSGNIQQLLQHTPSLSSKLSSLSSSSTQSNELSSDATTDNIHENLVEEKNTTTSIQTHQTKPLPIFPPLPLMSSSTTSHIPKTPTLVSLPTPKTVLHTKYSHYPSITHIQKNNGMRLRSFLCQSVLLDKTIRLGQHTLPNNPVFFKGSEEQTGQTKAILKLSMVKLSSTDTESSFMAQFGIGFVNSAGRIADKASGGSTATAINKSAVIPDSLILEALDVWMAHLHLPHLSYASHIMRLGRKLYIVFDRCLIQ